jgi:hypothetical protein
MNKNEELKTIQLVFFTLLDIVEQYPEYTIAQHFDFILKDKRSFSFSNSKLLKIVENYKLKLDNEVHDDDLF